MTHAKTDTTRYWGTAPLEEIVGEIENKVAAYQDWLDQSGYSDRMSTNYSRYYGLDAQGSLRLSKNEDGSLTRISVNHHRNLLQHTHILITQSKVAFQARARNSDSKSQTQANFANGLLEYYLEEKQLSRVFSKAAETALVFSEAFVEAAWDLHKGQEMRMDETTGEMLRAGDQTFQVRTPYDVIRDPAASEGATWYIVRKQVNKWDLAALYPQYAEGILATDPGNDVTSGITNSSSYRASNQDRDDLTETYTLYHDRTPAVPAGRVTVVCGDQVLENGELRYVKPPVFRLSAGDMLESVAGHTIGFDILPISEAINALFSAVVSNNVNFGVQNVWCPDPNLNVQKISEGMNLFTSGIEPKALQLTQSSPETYKLIDLLVNQSQVISAINSTARGNPEASLQSGNSLALMLSTAISFVSELQKAYSDMAGEVGSAVIQNIQRFASVPMIAAIGGKTKRAYVKEFTADDVSDIDRVTVELGNPVSQTFAGKLSMAEGWMKAGFIKSPQEYVSVLQTGNTDGLIEDQFNENTLIRAENEEIRNGVNPPVTLLDAHADHILRHRATFSDPETRRDPKRMEAALAHIQDHIAQMRQVPPDLAAIIQQPALPSQAQQTPPPGPQNGPQPPAQVQGVPTPSLPPNAPPEAQQAYQQAQDQMNQSPIAQGGPQ